MGFRAPKLIAALKPEIDAIIKKDGPLHPQVHASLFDLRTFLETFLFHFQSGQNGEYVSQSKDLFFMLFNRLSDAGIATLEEIGGHSAVWAKRAQNEGCNVFTAAQPTDFIAKSLPNSLQA